MEQMKVPEDAIVDYDYAHANRIIRVLKPIVFQDGDSFCCLLGPDPVMGVFGCGDTAEDAVEDWQDSLMRLMARPKSGDPVTEHIKEQLLSEEADRKEAARDFENQFRPREKH